MRTKWVLCVGLVSSLAFAQAPQPSLTPFPLELKRKPSGFSKDDGDELQKQFVRLVRKSGALVPDTASLELAIKELKRQDCEREDECLKQLALQAQTLYALYASVDYSLEGAVVATGRVVRDDGKIASALQTVSIPKGKDAFKDVAKVALVRLLEQLGLATLPPFRPVEAGTPPDGPKVDPLVKKDPDVKLPDPPPPPPPVVTPAGPSAGKIARWTLAGVGAVAAVVGVVVLAVANPQLDSSGVIVPQAGQTPTEAVAAYKAAKSQQTIGGVVAGVGGAVAVGGLVLALMSGGDEPAKTVSVVPVAGGAVVSVGGSF